MDYLGYRQVEVVVYYNFVFKKIRDKMRLDKEQIDSIKKLISSGRAADILALMEGESPYTSSEFSGAPCEKMAGRVYSMALQYLRFVTDFGVTTERVVRNGKVNVGYPNDFDEWLKNGAIGLISAEFERYILENPLTG